MRLPHSSVSLPNVVGLLGNAGDDITQRPAAGLSSLRIYSAVVERCDIEGIFLGGRASLATEEERWRDSYVAPTRLHHVVQVERHLAFIQVSVPG